MGYYLQSKLGFQSYVVPTCPEDGDTKSVDVWGVFGRGGGSVGVREGEGCLGRVGV